MNASDKSSGYRWAMRVGTEMVSATFIGVAMGYALDQWLQTRPWLTILFFLFGVAAGFLNLYRAVRESEGEGQGSGESGEPPERPEQGTGEGSGTSGPPAS